MNKSGNIHIGHLIKAVFEDSGISVSELARRIYVERTTVYSIFERPSVDIIQLVKISQALNHNFLSDIERHYGLASSSTSIIFQIDKMTPHMADIFKDLLDTPIQNGLRR